MMLYIFLFPDKYKFKNFFVSLMIFILFFKIILQTCAYDSVINNVKAEKIRIYDVEALFLITFITFLSIILLNFFKQ
jgi:hypothetical protein